MTVKFEKGTLVVGRLVSDTVPDAVTGVPEGTVQIWDDALLNPPVRNSYQMFVLGTTVGLSIGLVIAWFF